MSWSRCCRCLDLIYTVAIESNKQSDAQNFVTNLMHEEEAVGQVMDDDDEEEEEEGGGYDGLLFICVCLIFPSSPT